MKHATKLLGPKDIFATYDFAEVLSPLVEPVDDGASSVLIDQLKRLGFTSERPSSLAKLKVLLASFLMQAGRLESRRDRKGEPMVMGIPHDAVYWRKRSKVGYKVALRFREALVEHGWVTHQEQARIDLFHGDSNCNGYLVADFVPDIGKGLHFQSTEMVYATSTSASKTNIEIEAIDERTRALWEKWKQTPLVYSNQTMFIAPRRFNNAELNRGGRFYGPWTTMRKVERLECTIDGKPVSEVDVSGMNLTLLCSITGQIPFTARFKDAYECGYDNRDHVKAIVNETIGSGTHKHYTMGGLAKDVGLTQAQFTDIRKNFITPKFTCLQSLEKGGLDALTLAFHESEIMMRVVEQSPLPVFILHDCLICQKDDELVVGNLMQDVYAKYCIEQGWTPVAPAYTIERKGIEKHYVSGRCNP